MITPPVLAQNPEQVALKSKTGEGTYSTPYTLYQAERSALQQQAAGGGRGKLEVQAIGWRLWAADLAQAGAPNPKMGDQLVDAAGVAYVLGEVDVCFLGQVFDAEARVVPT